MGWDSSRVDMNIYSQGEIDRLVYSTCKLLRKGMRKLTRMMPKGMKLIWEIW